MQPTTTPKKSVLSYREAIAWACLAAILVTYVPYFRHIYWLLSASPRPGMAFPYGSLSAVRATVIEQIVLLAIFTSLITFWCKPENRDERDAAIETRAYRYAYLVFISLIFGLFLFTDLILNTFPFRPDNQGGVPFIAQLLLLSFVVAETIRYSIQVVGYRRGY